jgi:arylsulfatase B
LAPTLSPTSPTSPTVSPVDRPNVLLVLGDDMGTDKVAAYGEHPMPPSTPTLDALAADGVLFRNAYAYPACSSTRGALMTGRYGRRTGLGRAIDMYGDAGLSDAEWTVAESLGEAGYHTMALGKWHLAAYGIPDWTNAPHRAGFASYAGAPSNVWDSFQELEQQTHYYFWEKNTEGTLSLETLYTTVDTVDDALGALAEAQEPWLTYLAFNAPHGPFLPPPPELHNQDLSLTPGLLVRLYDAGVEALDTELGRLLDGIDPEVRGRTLVIFLGDNGTPEAGVAPPWVPQLAKLTMAEGGINVPMIVSGAGVVAPGRETDALVHVVDLLPTLAELAGGSVQADVDGLSFLPQLVDPDAPGPREVLYTERFGPNGVGVPRVMDQRAVRDGRFKLVRFDVGIEGLFDLQGRYDDGPELIVAGPLSAEAEEAYARLSEALDGWEAELGLP